MQISKLFSKHLIVCLLPLVKPRCGVLFQGLVFDKNAAILHILGPFPVFVFHVVFQTIFVVGFVFAEGTLEFLGITVDKVLMIF
jgi:hypothetical protein